MLKITLKILAFSAFLWLLLLAALPAILSTPKVKQFLLDRFNRKGAIKIEAESLNFSWFGPQVLKKVTYRDDRKSMLLTCEEIKIQNSFMSLLIFGDWTYQGRLHGLTAHIKEGDGSKLAFKDLSTDFELTADIYRAQIREVKLLQFPGALFEDTLKVPNFQALFGSSFEVTLGFPPGATPQIPVYDVTVQGEETALHAGIAIKDQALITRPGSSIQLKWTATSQREQLLREWLLPKANPAELALAAPAKLTITLEDLNIPLRDFNINILRIGNSKMELGQMSFKNSGVIAKILKLLTSTTSEEVTLWLTPAYFSISGGTVNLQRVDMLAMSLFHCALWGTIDLPTGQLNMRVGIPLQSLAQGVGIPESIGNQMLQLPLSGTLAKIELDTSVTKKKIGSLASNFLGSKLPKAWSDAVKKVAGTDESDEIPPPTTSPLPWEMGLKNKKESAQE